MYRSKVELKNGELNDVKSLYTKYKDDKDVVSKNGKMVYVTGAAFKAKRFNDHKSLLELTKYIQKPPSSIIALNPEKSMILPSINKGELLCLDAVRYKQRFAYAYSEILVPSMRPFFLIDENDEKIMVNPGDNVKLLGKLL